MSGEPDVTWDKPQQFSAREWAHPLRTAGGVTFRLALEQPCSLDEADTADTARGLPWATGHAGQGKSQGGSSGPVWTPGAAAAGLHFRGAEGRGGLYLKGLLSSMNQLVPFQF